MTNAITGNLLIIFIWLYDRYEFLKNFVQSTILRQHLVVRSTTVLRPLSADLTRRLAVFVAYPSEDSISFTINCLRALRDNGCYTVFVSALPVKPHWRKAIGDLADQIIERGNAGRDFGSYRVGLLRLGLLDKGCTLEPYYSPALLNSILRERVRDIEDLGALLLLMPLPVQVLAGAPLKRDVVYRGVNSIGQVMSNLVGYTEVEKTAMRRDLERKGLPRSRKLLDRTLHAIGRI